jgi:hypothetical protein
MICGIYGNPVQILVNLCGATHIGRRALSNASFTTFLALLPAALRLSGPACPRAHGEQHSRRGEAPLRSSRGSYTLHSPSAAYHASNYPRGRRMRNRLIRHQVVSQRGVRVGRDGHPVNREGGKAISSNASLAFTSSPDIRGNGSSTT